VRAIGFQKQPLFINDLLAGSDAQSIGGGAGGKVGDFKKATIARAVRCTRGVDEGKIHTRFTNRFPTNAAWREIGFGGGVVGKHEHIGIAFAEIAREGQRGIEISGVGGASPERDLVFELIRMRHGVAEQTRAGAGGDELVAGKIAFGQNFI
jgi:hypothetical protein